MPKYVVRHGAMRTLGLFVPRGSESFLRGNRVIVRTSRGLEAGEVLCEATPEALEHLRDPDNGQLVRGMTTDDENELSRIWTSQKRVHDLCDQAIGESGLDMRLVDVEQIFGGERVIVYYLSEVRVDFRDLVKRLAGEFQTRIEMRQIGVRDEAKLLADYGDCGKPVCCNTHLSEMPPVSMKMAKLQKATLDPNKISGRCGRLKCCLRYEYDTYEELQKALPPIGCDVITRNGRARVLAHEILASQLLVSTEDNRRVLIAADEVLTVVTPEGRGPRPPRTDDEEQHGEERGRDDRPRGGRGGERRDDRGGERKDDRRPRGGPRHEGPPPAEQSHDTTPPQIPPQAPPPSPPPTPTD